MRYTCKDHEIIVRDKGLVIDGICYAWDQLCVQVLHSKQVFVDPGEDLSKRISRNLRYPQGEFRFSDCDPTLVEVIDDHVRAC